jgi:hypothetical protein
MVFPGHAGIDGTPAKPGMVLPEAKQAVVKAEDAEERPSVAEAHVDSIALMYGLKPVPFARAVFPRPV